MNLQMSLIGKWFEMTKAGIKTEDYREITDYWVRRLTIDFSHKHDEDGVEINVKFKEFKTNTLTFGYPKKGDLERIIQFEHSGIEVRTGNPEWGAEPGKLYFVIKHGRVIQQ